MEKTDSLKIIVYGSLRPNHYNYDRLRSAFGPKSLKRVEGLILEGYDLYDLGAYPGIVPGKGEITCDVLEASTEAADFIRSMELGANYSEKIINGARIYIYNGSVEGRKKVESGDWSKYTK